VNTLINILMKQCKLFLSKKLPYNSSHVAALKALALPHLSYDDDEVIPALVHLANPARAGFGRCVVINWVPHRRFNTSPLANISCFVYINWCLFLRKLVLAGCGSPFVHI